MQSTQPVWRAPVRYAEVDQQGIAFHAHYLTWCDEAMGAFCQGRGLLAMAERVHVVSSALTWRSSAVWGEVVEVDAACVRVGRSSFDMRLQWHMLGVNWTRTYRARTASDDLFANIGQTDQ